MKEITPELREAYIWSRTCWNNNDILELSTALLDTLAELMQSEFRLEYQLNETYDLESDERHLWTDEQWQAAAEKLLSGEG